MIRIENLHHVSVTVTNLARSRRFYSEVLGLRELPRPNFPVDGAWYAAGDRQVHLIVFPETQMLRARRDIDVRETHFALRVADFDETTAHLRAHGVEVLDRFDNVTDWAQIYILDPDGNIIELNVDRK
jgi:catechol 2,3-dioxygenase-like lactoylglutathione lyase family enzyme